ncbi:dTDP-4-dehydrorhamnose 3,5-epimerase [Roseibium album]|nr:dTDP-4-dehydrorhamnose 3,5-epimerase [Roseibium album]
MTRRFEIEHTPLRDFVVLTRKPVGDQRGWFERLYCADELESVNLTKPIRQINRSFTRRQGTIRGLHFQHPPQAETKLVSCLRGRVFDVAVDLRRGSSTFLNYHGVELSEHNSKTAFIPKGFAHGFQTLTPDCVLLYLHTANYTPTSEDGVHPLDRTLSIAWPEDEKFLSDRDANLPSILEDFEGVQL